MQLLIAQTRSASSQHAQMQVTNDITALTNYSIVTNKIHIAWYDVLINIAYQLLTIGRVITNMVEPKSLGPH